MQADAVSVRVSCCAQEQKAKKAARQAKREPSLQYAPSQTHSYGPTGAPLHEVSSYASSTHMGSPGYYSPVHPSGETGWLAQATQHCRCAAAGSVCNEQPTGLLRTVGAAQRMCLHQLLLGL
jgi:hypothetical protein